MSAHLLLSQSIDIPAVNEAEGLLHFGIKATALVLCQAYCLCFWWGWSDTLESL
jgi:hypothetical protein